MDVEKSILLYYIVECYEGLWCDNESSGFVEIVNLIRSEARLISVRFSGFSFDLYSMS